MYSEPDPPTAARMRKALAQAVDDFDAEPDTPGEFWGWNGRTLSRSVATSAYGPCWLRLASAPAEKAGGKLWDGPQDAEALIPYSVPRPRLHQRQVWNEGPHGYLAELYQAVAAPTITTDSPVLQVAPPLDSSWWAALAGSLRTIATVPTQRVAVRQEYLHRAMPEYLGTSIDSTVREWSTAHGDLHWANLTGPELHILDWEGWGLAPAGYDAAMLHTYSLLVPATAAHVREYLGHILATPAGRFAELVVITELLQTISRGDNRALEAPIDRRLAQLLQKDATAGG